MSSARVSLASRTASLDSVRATLINGTDGLTRSTSFAEYDPCSRTWKTYQACLLGGASSYGELWRKVRTDSGALRLRPVSPPTSDVFTETWPKSGTTRSGVAYPLPKQELRIAAIDGGVLPTPATVDTGTMFNRSAIEGAALRPTLGAMARFNLWPTPHGFSPDGKSNGPSGNELGRAVNQFMTPMAAARDSTPKQFKRGNPNLAAQVGGSLNPTWVEWLMGWPLGWTDLEPLETDRFLLWCEQHGIS